jgi:hypothetical protein
LSPGLIGTTADAIGEGVTVADGTGVEVVVGVDVATVGAVAVEVAATVRVGVLVGGTVVGMVVGIAVGWGGTAGPENRLAPPPTIVCQVPQSSTTVNGTVTEVAPDGRFTMKFMETGVSTKRTLPSTTGAGKDVASTTPALSLENRNSRSRFDVTAWEETAVTVTRRRLVSSLSMATWTGGRGLQASA